MKSVPLDKNRTLIQQFPGKPKTRRNSVSSSIKGVGPRLHGAELYFVLKRRNLRGIGIGGNFHTREAPPPVGPFSVWESEGRGSTVPFTSSLSSLGL